MKLIQKAIDVKYQFRCTRCKSAFEMMKDEWDENYTPSHKFDCPVCGKDEYMDEETIHRFIIMDTGEVYKDY